jgi:hypothetical protein
MMEAEEIIARGQPPMADGVILIDFDGVIAPFGHLFDFPPPMKDSIESIRAYKAAGWKVYVFTSRLSPIWLESVGQSMLQHAKYITEYLQQYGIVVDGITAQKIPASHYIDDHAHRFEGNWPELVDRILRP